MQTNTISAGYNTAYSLGAGSKEVKNGEGFADALLGISKKTPTITSSEGLTLRYRKDYVADDGSKCLTSWVDARTGVNTCVFKPSSFSTKETDEESMDLSEAIRHFEEMHKITAEELKETDDWRNMSKDQWDKLLEGVDVFIDAQIERLREMKEVQEEAARKAAMMAPPDMRTVAASQAALDVAASGFMGATEPDAGTEHEKNGPKTLLRMIRWYSVLPKQHKRWKPWHRQE